MSQQLQVQFIRCAKKPGCDMMKVIIPGRKQEGEWVDCPQNVKNFASNSFQEGQQVMLTADFLNNKYNASRIEAVGGGAPQAQAQTAPAPVNQPPVQQQYTPPVQQQQTYTPPADTGAIAPPQRYMNPKTPEESAQIMRLSVYASACEAAKALTGQVDVNSICDIIDAIYQRGLANAKK